MKQTFQTDIARYRPESSQFAAENTSYSLFLQGLAADLGVSAKLLATNLLSGVNSQKFLSDDPQNCTFYEVGQTSPLNTFELTNAVTSYSFQFATAYEGYFVKSIEVAITGYGTVGDDPKCSFEVEGLSKVRQTGLIGSNIVEVPINSVISSDIKFHIDAGGVEAGDKIRVLVKATAFLPDEAFRQSARRQAAAAGVDITAPYRHLDAITQKNAAYVAGKVLMAGRGRSGGRGGRGGGGAPPAASPMPTNIPLPTRSIDGAAPTTLLQRGTGLQMGMTNSYGQVLGADAMSAIRDRRV